jgi:hypothetical protein
MQIMVKRIRDDRHAGLDHGKDAARAKYARSLIQESDGSFQVVQYIDHNDPSESALGKRQAKGVADNVYA